MANTLDDGDQVEVKGSTSTYTLQRLGNVYSCTCPAWRNQGATIDMRTCKHLRAYLGDDVETARIGVTAPTRSPATQKKAKAAAEGKAPPVLLAHKWEIDHDPTGWWMSEKLDGIRAYWDGEAFISRLGNKFFAPDWFVADLPADTLDGELWLARKKFPKTMSIVRSGAGGEEWKQVTYVVFDAPNAKGTFEDRLAHVQKVLAKSEAPYARWHEHVRCEGVVHLKRELERVEQLGGEGLMLRQPKSPYVAGRSNTLLKVKTFYDTEARVIEHAPGSGKHKGRLGALVVALPNGVRFNVGTGFSDEERENPPNIGSVITFRYQELSDDGVPRFPSYVGERIDVELPPTPVKGASNKTIAPPAPVATAPNKAAAPPPPKQATPREATTPDQPARRNTGEADYHVRLEIPDEKFWEIEVRGSQHITKFGALGSSGSMRLTECKDGDAARADAEKRVAAKRKEGYGVVS